VAEPVRVPEPVRLPDDVLLLVRELVRELLELTFEAEDADADTADTYDTNAALADKDDATDWVEETAEDDAEDTAVAGTALLDQMNTDPDEATVLNVPVHDRVFV
jgi:hypothetical protein